MGNDLSHPPAHGLGNSKGIHEMSAATGAITLPRKTIIMLMLAQCAIALTGAAAALPPG